MLSKVSKLLRQPIKLQRQSTIALNGHDLTIEKLSLLGRGSSKVHLEDQTWEKLRASRQVVERLANEKTDKPYYGINSGVGLFSNQKLTGSDLKEFQINLIRSHATGIGENLELEASRRIHVLRINTLAKGFSGISLGTMERLIDFFNSGAVPQIPSSGTVGASGDLVPLAHIGLNLIGEGEIWNPRTNEYETAVSVLREYNLQIANLQEKDALSLINGNQFLCGVGSIALEQSINIIKSIAPISALTFLSMKGLPIAFDTSIQRIRMHPGQNAVAQIMRELLPVGKTVTYSQELQDPYSLKCIPQVHGPTLEAIVNTKECLEIEMNSGSDNPLIFTEPPYIMNGGNFHGEYPAKQLDVLGLYVHEIGSLSSQRIKRLTNPTKNLGLPAFLVSQGGLCSGMMTWENVAASLVSENKVLVYPASADSTETCADKEDHVSMGSASAKKAISIAQNVQQILAVELMAATQALQHRFELEKDFYIYHPGLKKVFEHCKTLSPLLVKDRYTQPEYQELLAYIQSGELWDTMMQEMTFEYLNYQAPDQFSTLSDSQSF
ncbi:histidine ammonia-lyase [Stylonychia lemnae]|uniref:Histidine ammonia-lyase n=1 Tax=Stylonychia lemnae TaxID=5949 RepID=A0A078B869_STYLE|nr:histidine ammonia-lyase [Stylonychia lemnae]|eukprot:CDW90715.1 histidine ammonia-lyase [Stylonychia lemnae]